MIGNILKRNASPDMELKTNRTIQSNTHCKTHTFHPHAHNTIHYILHYINHENLMKVLNIYVFPHLEMILCSVTSKVNII